MKIGPGLFSQREWIDKHYRSLTLDELIPHLMELHLPTKFYRYIITSGGKKIRFKKLH